MNKATGQFVILRGPTMAKATDGTDSDFLSMTIVKNDDKLDITGYEFTGLRGGVEEWTWKMRQEDENNGH